MNHFVEVILPLSFSKTLTYTISEAEFYFIKKGMRVAVPVKNKIYTGLVVDIHNIPPILYEPKEINQILDKNPIVTEIQINHWFWIANYYMCTIGEVYKTAMPSALLLESETIIIQNKETFVDEKNLSDDEFLIFEAFQYQSSLKVQNIIDILQKKTILPVINKLIEKKIISLQEEIQEEYKPKLTRYIKLSDQYSKEESLLKLINEIKSEKQKTILLSYFQLKTFGKPISSKQLIEKASINSNVLKRLIEKDIFEEYFIQVDRVNFNSIKADATLQLSYQQLISFNQINNEFQTKEVCLLHGVTGSGKTEIYIKLIEDYLITNRQILFLLPEIALTTQLVSRLTFYFGNKISVFHSKYTNNERVEVWKNVLDNSEKAQIIIGTRSSLFLPFNDLGLIILDEEHEQTYKQQDPAPRYHARDAAIILANYHQAKVLLGSATPSLETYNNAISGKFGLVRLSERYGKMQLPSIELIDLKECYFRKKMKGHFSMYLIDAISDVFDKKEQVILFQNRRGYSPVLECLTCGHFPQCPQCDVSLTFHKLKNQLRCHYCGHNIAKPINCHVCSSKDLETKGFGTEQIELELAELFPSKNIKRMDQDTTKGKYSLEKIIEGFKNQEIDVLIGTQMLAKGLDFNNVSLVGILNADNLMYNPDFRSLERSFQLMTQVAGRAGRSEKKGKVIIQTFNPSHPIIQKVIHNDYTGMFDEQLKERQVFNYPPFFRLIKLTLKHRDFQKLNEGALWFYQVLKQNLSIPVLGPEEPVVSRIRNEYIKTIMIKIPQDSSLTNTKKTIQKVLNSFNSVAQYKSIKVAINVDFY